MIQTSIVVFFTSTVSNEVVSFTIGACVGGWSIVKSDTTAYNLKVHESPEAAITYLREHHERASF